MNENIILTTIKEEQLQQIISDAVQQAFVVHQKKPREVPEEDKLLDRNEVLELLKISAVTLWSRMKEGDIPFKKLGRRVLFSKRDILNSLSENKKGASHVRK
jgi:predicted DNA-binding transcriptional regulator AlpA